MPDTTIHLSQARGVRIRCTCGAEATVPVGAANAPAQCFNCAKPWPAPAVQELAGMLAWVKQASGNGKVSVDLLLLGPDNPPTHSS